MGFSDLWQIAFRNLRKTRLRSTLTLLGVSIGIGSLVSMVSFGTGMEKNIRDAIAKQGLFTRITVSAGKIPDLSSLNNLENAISNFDSVPEKISDSLLQVIQNYEEVAMAYPEITFSGKVSFNGNEKKVTVQAVPGELARDDKALNLHSGSFFETDTVFEVILSYGMLDDLGLKLKTDEKTGLSKEDSAKNLTLITPEEILGDTMLIATAVLNLPGNNFNPLMMMASRSFQRAPFSEHQTPFVIKGIRNKEFNFSRSIFSAEVLVPMETGKNLPRASFNNVWDYLDSSKKNKQGYDVLNVTAKDMADITPLINKIKKMGLSVFSFFDQFEEIKRSFLIVNSLLSVVGTIALIVAALGIVNTMVMSVMERTREIGIMKAIGGAESDIRKIFLLEASVIGLVGALFGLLLGWGVTRIANMVLNTQIMPAGEEPVNLFYFPWWLIAGAIAFSILVSVVSGLYPASKAAATDPVKALRHD